MSNGIWRRRPGRSRATCAGDATPPPQPLTLRKPRSCRSRLLSSGAS